MSALQTKEVKKYKDKEMKIQYFQTENFLPISSKQYFQFVKKNVFIIHEFVL